MNILFIASFRISPNSGGVQRVTETLAREFKKCGHQVYYLSFSKGDKEVIEGIDQYYLPKGKDYSNYENVRFFKKIVEENKIEIIINQIGFPLKELYFIKNNISKDVKVLSVHHNCLKCLNDQYHNIYRVTLKSKGLFNLFNNKFGWFLLRKIHKFRFGKEIKDAIKLSDKVVLLSDKFIPEIGFYVPDFNKSKVIGIPNPNPFSGLKNPVYKKENDLLHVGRLEYGQKRVDRIIEIWSKISQKFPNWNFHIVGDGTMRRELEKKVLKNKIERIHFHGFQDPRPFYKKAKIFCLTSSFEGYGMVLVEAQTFGVVPISNKSFSSINDVISDKESGIIIEDFNFDNYLEELQKLMLNHELLETMSKKGIKHVEKFDSKLIASQWIDLFNTVINY